MSLKGVVCLCKAIVFGISGDTAPLSFEEVHCYERRGFFIRSFLRNHTNVFSNVSYSKWLLLGFAALLTGLILTAIQGSTLRFGLIDTKTYLMLMGMFSLLGFFSYLIIILRYPTQRRKRLLLCSGMFFVLVGITQLNCNPLPNVVLIVSDATRADHLSLYGYNRLTTPFLETLAPDAIVFDQAMSQGTHTIVSTPSLLASVYPSTHKLVNYRNVLDPKFELISETLKRAGYATFGCAANPHLGITNGFSPGFDTYLFPMHWEDVDAPKVFGSLIDWLPRAGPQPFFGFLFCIDPHTPYNPPPPYNTLFDPSWEDKPVTAGIRGKPMPEAKLRNLIAQYDGEIALVDKAIGDLVAALQARDLFANTVLVYTSDHGEALYDRDNDFGHGKAPYEEVVRIPLLIRFPSPLKFPSVTFAGRCDEVVSHVDILPTIADFLHLERPKSAMGLSFLDVLENKKPEREKIAFLEQILEQYGPYHIQALRTKNYKLIKFLNYENDTTRTSELYDLVHDPKEKKNLFFEKPDLAKKLQAKMEVMERLVAGKAGEPAKEIEVDQDTVDRLRTLGYL